MRTTLICHVLLLAACAKPNLPPRAAVEPDAPESRAPREESLAVSGLLGTLSQLEIQNALEPRLPKFLRCATQRRAQLDVLAGTLTMRFNVAVDGSVDHVQPAESTLGDREAERCMLEVATATHFPAPHGGEAEFRWPLELPPDAEVRPPVELLPDPAREPLAEGRPELHAKCGGGPVVVTAYIDPTGQVQAAGVSASELATPSELDCVAEGIRALRFESPGSYVGKLSFSLP
ncbi:MAG TPA: AgmX/PglI C-terminal domain-containing protein [Polyangiales bacterium]|nr:AgmX/PglI C-terminal domain-containing protein [Polyangiales bacterium]